MEFGVPNRLAGVGAGIVHAGVQRDVDGSRATRGIGARAGICAGGVGRRACRSHFAEQRVAATRAGAKLI
jgi:hypothetical protein